MLHDLVKPRLVECLSKLHTQGDLVPPDELQRCYDRFRREFGPEQLATLDGTALLDRMHGRSESRDSLMYWLEFKNDDEFPRIFGSIAGGSALKFGIYQSAKTGQWMRYSSGQRSGAPISEDAAIEFATRQRDQLVTGANLSRAVL